MADDRAPAPPAMEIVERIMPILTHARRDGWDINFSIEWRDGERFTISGHLPAESPREAADD